MRRHLLLLAAALLVALAAPAAAAAAPLDPPAPSAWEATSLLSAVGADDVAFGDALHGCICSESMGWHTGDGGATWIELPSLAGLWTLEYGDADHVWACGDAGRIAASADGGATWSEQVSGVGWTLDSMDFVDAVHGWAISNEGAVLRTANGGLTWEAVGACAPAEEFWTISFVDTLHGWAAAGGTTVWVTADGGLTWQSMVHAYWTTTFGMQFLDLQHGWAATGDGVYRTDDGGSTWQLGAYPSGYNWLQVSDVAAIDRQRVWAITTGGLPMISADGGLTWRFQTVDWHGADFWQAVYALCVVGDEGWAVRCRGYGYNERVVAHTSRSGYGDAEPPTTTITPAVLPLFTTSGVTCHLSATDAGTGVAATYYCVRQGEYGPASWQTGTEFTTPSSDGEWRVDYCSEDVYGNVEAVQEQVVNVDRTPPTTSFTPRNEDELDYWINHSSSVVIDASDRSPSPGLGETMVSLGDAPFAPWVRGSEVVTDAPGDHSNDGLHVIRGYTADNVGNVEPVQGHVVGIDTRKPVCKLPYPVSCVTKGYAKVSFRVNDARPSTPQAVVEFRVKTLGGRLLGQVLPGKWFPKRRLVSYRFRVPLRPGRYRLLLRAGDGAGNVSGWARTTLTVRRANVGLAGSSLSAGGAPPAVWGGRRDVGELRTVLSVESP